MALKWQIKYSVGNDFIDDQHKVIIHLISLIETYAGQADSDVDPKAVGDTIDRLLAYTKSHFADEEEIMARHNYGGLQRHKEIHSNLVEQTISLQKKHRDIGNKVLPVLLEFLQTWLATHILGVDMKYKPFIGRFEKPLVSAVTDADLEKIRIFLTQKATEVKAKGGSDHKAPLRQEVSSGQPVNLISEYMTKRSLDRTFFVSEDLTIDQSIQIMKEKDVTSLLLLNPADEVIGIVTERDIVRRYAALDVDGKANRRIGAIASRPVRFVRMEHYREDIQAILSTVDVRHFPVVKGDQRRREDIVGFLEISDIAALGLLPPKKS